MLSSPAPSHYIYCSFRRPYSHLATGQLGALAGRFLGEGRGDPRNWDLDQIEGAA